LAKGAEEDARSAVIDMYGSAATEEDAEELLREWEREGIVRREEGRYVYTEEGMRKAIERIRDLTDRTWELIRERMLGGCILIVGDDVAIHGVLDERINSLEPDERTLFWRTVVFDRKAGVTMSVIVAARVYEVLAKVLDLPEEAVRRLDDVYLITVEYKGVVGGEKKVEVRLYESEEDEEKAVDEIIRMIREVTG
jgi:DNA-binding Lrp family transcriptional regulator